MDPHFLYNTLESINWRAKMIHSEEISQITTSLGSLLRLSLGKNSEHFTLAQEMEIVNNYITIQKIRYQRRLDFSADVPPGCSLPPYQNLPYSLCWRTLYVTVWRNLRRPAISPLPAGRSWDFWSSGSPTPALLLKKIL